MKVNISQTIKNSLKHMSWGEGEEKKSLKDLVSPRDMGKMKTVVKPLVFYFLAGILF
jgi:hypothetical protein